jgi:hypothetical protein
MRRPTLGRHRIGRRGAVLLLFSAAFLLIGLKALTDPSTDDGRFVFYTLLPTAARGALWGVPAVIGILSVLSRRHGDAAGFAVICVPPLFLMASYLWSFIGFLSGATDYPYGWVSAVTWALIAAVLLVTAGWPEEQNAPDGAEE